MNGAFFVKHELCGWYARPEALAQDIVNEGITTINVHGGLTWQLRVILPLNSNDMFRWYVDRLLCCVKYQIGERGTVAIWCFGQ